MECNANTLQAGSYLKGTEHTYRIAKVLGQGTFGITYLAYVSIKGRLGAVEMPVAVKEFFMQDFNERAENNVVTGSGGGTFEKYRKKFLHEARNLSRLSHPGIVKVIEAFEENNTCYFSMEYCDGGSLESLVRGHGISEREARKYFKQIGCALSFMHKHGMLHLDLKPNNIMLRGSGEAVLIDFGLSKQFSDDGNPETSTSIGFGTPGYAPIEQANYRVANDGKIPVTIDIYALGATLYKMLTGSKPPLASEVLREFPSQALFDHGVSNGVVCCIRRAMQSIPENRYQSVDDFLAAIETVSMPVDPIDDVTVIGFENDNDNNNNNDSVRESDKKNKGKRTLAVSLVAALASAIVGVAVVLVFNYDSGVGTVAEHDVLPIGDSLELVQQDTASSVNVVDELPVVEQEPPRVVEDVAEPTDDELFARAMRNGDISTLLKLGNRGYAKAYVPLAEYYYNKDTAADDAKADFWCQKARKAGIVDADKIIHNLEVRGYYD